MAQPKPAKTELGLAKVNSGLIGDCAPGAPVPELGVVKLNAEFVVKDPAPLLNVPAPVETLVVTLLELVR